MEGRGIDEAEIGCREEAILKRGLPCVVASLRRNGAWSCLELSPLTGFLHLVSEEIYAGYVARGETYHVSLGYDVDERLLEALERRWVGQVVDLEIDRFTMNHVAVLAWRGLGADADAWAAFAEGYPQKLSFGLHISM